MNVYKQIEAIVSDSLYPKNTRWSILNTAAFVFNHPMQNTINYSKLLLQAHIGV